MVRGARYRHTNIVSRDWVRLSAFYELVFGCERLPPERDLRGEWLDRGTGVVGAHLRGVHLRLPGSGSDGPTLEIFEYDEILPRETPVPNRAGFGHIAFAVEDVGQAVEAVIAAGGAPLGEIVEQDIPGAGRLCFSYVRDPEGNIVELQAWS
jgi:predicted enzyme related to lactoylglutathione lyase